MNQTTVQKAPSTAKMAKPKINTLAPREELRRASVSLSYSYVIAVRPGPRLTKAAIVTTFEWLGRRGGKVRQNSVRPGPFEARQGLQHGSFAVQPAVLGGRHDHRVFAGHLVDERRHPEGVFDPPDDIQVRHPGL